MDAPLIRTITKRQFITLAALIGTASAAGLMPVGGVLAQITSRPVRIIIVHTAFALADLKAGRHPYYPILIKELVRLGYVEGRDFEIDWRSAAGEISRYPEIAREIVASKPDIIVANGATLLGHLKAATTSIPLVGVSGDPVAYGLVASLARPGGNLTGVSTDPGLDTLEKYLELLKEVVPGASKVGYVTTRPIWTGPRGERMREAGRQEGISVVGLIPDTPPHEANYRRLFEDLPQRPVDALVIAEIPENFTHRALLVELTNKARVPAIFPYDDVTKRGALIAYAVDLAELYRVNARTIDKIIKGAKPGEIPIDQGKNLILSLNLKTASALGLAINPSLLGRADEVIE